MTARRINIDFWVTITHNNRCAEMLAHVRRGPFARPITEERIEHLLTRVQKKSCVAFGEHALEHTLSLRVTIERSEIQIRGLKLRPEVILKIRRNRTICTCCEETLCEEPER